MFWHPRVISRRPPLIELAFQSLDGLGVVLLASEVVPFSAISDDIEEGHVLKIAAPRLLAWFCVGDDELEPPIANPTVGDVLRGMPERRGIAGVDFAKDWAGCERLMSRRRGPQALAGQIGYCIRKTERIEQRRDEIDTAAQILVRGGFRVPVPANENRRP